MTTAELTIEEALEKIQEARDALKNAIDTYGKKAIISLLETLVEKHKDKIDGFTWTQYTPYFNDGDPCIFSVHGVNAVPRNEEPDKCLWENGAGELLWQKKEGKFPEWASDELVEDMKRIDDIFSSNEEVLETVFGDHNQITANADGILVEEHEHD